MKDTAYGLLALAVVGSLVVGIVWSFVWGWQYFKVFNAEQTGRAELAQAEQNRQIAVLEAQAANEAATSQAEAKVKIAEAEARAEVERAKGVAEANRIIGDSLRGNADYLRYLYITGITNGSNQMIYVPTESGLPILEANRLKM